MLRFGYDRRLLLLLMTDASPPSASRPTAAGGIADVVENANAMAARTDVTKKATGSQKRDIDYLTEYAGFVREYEAAKTASEKTGAAFDDAPVLAKIKSALGVAAVDAELDAKK